MQVAFWNANGLRSKKLQLQEFAERHKLDAILVNETHLRQGDKVRIPNYTMYRNDREDRTGGGTAIYVKMALEHRHVPLPPRENMEATAIEVETRHAGFLRLIAVYRPPNRRLLETDLDSLWEANVPTIAAGDLNSKHQSWNSLVANPSGNALRSYVDRRDLVCVGPVEPTHYPPQ